MPDDTPVRSRLYDMARDIIEKPTNKNIITLRDEALRLAADVRDMKAQRNTAEAVCGSAERSLESMLQENTRLKAEVERLKNELYILNDGMNECREEVMRLRNENPPTNAYAPWHMKDRIDE